MRTTTLSFLAACLFSAGVEAGVVYSEDFSSDPNYTIYNPNARSGDSWQWLSVAGTYSATIYEAQSNAQTPKFALSSQFSRVENQSFSISLDMKPVHSSWGMWAQIKLIDTNRWNPAGTLGMSIVSDYDVNHGGYTFGIGDGVAHEAPGLYHNHQSIDSSAFYHFSVDYNALTSTVDILINDALGSIFYQSLDIPWTALSFNQIEIGSDTQFWDGNYAQIEVDNIRIQTSDATSVPEPPSLLLFGIGLFVVSRIGRIKVLSLTDTSN